jgi:hypothetical protein
MRPEVWQQNSPLTTVDNLRPIATKVREWDGMKIGRMPMPGIRRTVIDAGHGALTGHRL